MILFGGEISISRQIVTEKTNAQVIAPLGGSGITAGVIPGGCVDCVWWASNFSGCILAVGLRASERGSDLRGRQANSRLFLFSRGRGRVRRVFLSHCLKMNGGFVAMRQQRSVKRLGDLGWRGFYAEHHSWCRCISSHKK